MFRSLIDLIRDKTKVQVRFDLAACSRCDLTPERIFGCDVMEKTLRTSDRIHRLKVRELLEYALANLNRDGDRVYTVRPSPSGILIVPAYQHVPKNEQQAVEQVFGPPVTLFARARGLSEVLRDLAEPSGREILFAAPESADVPVSMNSVDCPLLFCLRKIVIQTDLKLVAVGNGFVVTTPDKAKELEQEVKKDQQRLPAK
jgi:hypothetical protein